MSKRPLLNYSPELLGPVLKAYGLDRVEEWLEPEALRRIEIYLLTFALKRPSAVAHQLLEMRQQSAIELLEYTRERINRYLQPDFVRKTLEEAIRSADSTFVEFKNLFPLIGPYSATSGVSRVAWR